MANNYLNFSVAFEVAPEAAEWARQYYGSEDHQNKLEELDAEPEAPGFVLSIQGSEMIVYSDSGEGNVESATSFISDVLRKHGNVTDDWNAHVLFEWAETCSSSRPGEFGGGYCLVFHDIIEYPPDRYQWVNTVLKLRELESA